MGASKFMADFRETKPGLHLLYVKTAVVHLKAIDETLQRFSDFANTNMTDILVMLDKERKKLVASNAAYADADEILKSIAPKSSEIE